MLTRHDLPPFPPSSRSTIQHQLTVLFLISGTDVVVVKGVVFDLGEVAVDLAAKNVLALVF